MNSKSFLYKSEYYLNITIKSIHIFNRNLIYLVTKAVLTIGQTKKHYLIFKITVLYLQNSFLFCIFSNSYHIVSTN